jgi:DNA-binding CsgD family transcriptional regulator
MRERALSGRQSSGARHCVADGGRSPDGDGPQWAGAHALDADWPGRSAGLTRRESEILCLISQGKSNAEVAATVFLSANSVKSHIRSTYRKIGVTRRTQAVLWGVAHGFGPDGDA